MLRISIGIFCLLIGHFLAAQVPIFRQVERPENPELHTWHFNTETQEIFVFDGEEWQGVPIKYARYPIEWKGLVRIGTGDMKALAMPNGKILLNPCHWIRNDSALFLAFVCGDGTYILNRDGDTLSFCGANDNHGIFELDTIAGQIVYCVPAFDHSEFNDRRNHEPELRNWGMLSTDGKWLIEPKYDHLLHFEKGIAEVFLNGKVLKIDEKGNIVE